MTSKARTKIFMGMVALGLLLLTWGRMPAAVQAADSAWQAKYWNNTNLTGDPVLERTESELNHDWGRGSPADGIVNTSDFSARWQRSVNFSAGTYRFSATMDDGMRVWVDEVLIIDSWTDSQVHTLTHDLFLASGDHVVKVKYYDAGGDAVAKLSWTAVSGTAPATVVNWKGEYFNNTNLSGTAVLVRDDANISFNWGNGSPASGLVANDQFSVRWSRSMTFAPGRYRFTAAADDGVRVWVNNQQLINAWYDHQAQSFSGEIDLPATSVPVRVEYYEHGGGAEINFSWTQLTGSSQPTPTPVPSVPTGNTGVVQSSRLNVRFGPGLSYGVITQLTKGQTVSLAGYRSADSHWVMINWNNSTAWVSGLPPYLSTNVPISSLSVWSGSVPAPGSSVPGPTATVITVYYLNIRSGPDVSFGVIKAMPNGTLMTLLGRNAAATWANVRLADGTVGWMSARYLSTSVPLNNLPITG